MDVLLQDLRYGLRMLLSRPGFTAVALAALALGIGANTAIFSVVNVVLLQPLPYKDPDRLVMLWHSYAGMNLPKASLSVPSYIEYRDHMPSFESVAAGMNWSANLTGAGEPERVQGARVTANFLATLGVAPAIGRDFLAEEDRPGSDRVVVLTPRPGRIREILQIDIPRPRSLGRNDHIDEVARCSALLHELLMAPDAVAPLTA